MILKLSWSLNQFSADDNFFGLRPNGIGCFHRGAFIVTKSNKTYLSHFSSLIFGPLNNTNLLSGDVSGSQNKDKALKLLSCMILHCLGNLIVTVAPWKNIIS